MTERSHTSHYCEGSIECIDYIADQGWMEEFCLGNIVKYATRCQHKGQLLEDVKMALRGAKPIHFHCRLGGMLVSPEEVVEKIDAIRAGRLEEVANA